MADKQWEISYESAKEMREVATALEESSEELLKANERILYAMENNRQLGPHRMEIAQAVANAEVIAKKSSMDAKSLASRIRATAKQIEEICDRAIKAGYSTNSGN